uniref:Secreted protein n=1 Tax=Cacopsylla melanoneura TaxID=428564 RepID=A0A8D9A7K8_9HEMI
MSFLSSTTPLLVTLAFIFLQPFTVSTDSATEHPEMVPSMALDGVCKQTNTAVCPKGFRDSEPVCESYAKAAGGKSSRCTAENGCSFMIKVNGVNNVVYVSHGKKITEDNQPSVTYKTCPNNGMILYTVGFPDVRN